MQRGNSSCPLHPPLSSSHPSPSYGVLSLYFFLSPQIRLYARPDAIASGAGDYALHITKRMLQFYEDYFKVKYSLPKLGRTPSKHTPAYCLCVCVCVSVFFKECVNVKCVWRKVKMEFTV